MTKANEIAKYGEPYCPNYRCSDCGQTRPCKRRIDWNVVKRTHPFFTRFTDSFPCSDFFPSAIHVFDLKNYWTNFESWYTDYLLEWQNGKSREVFERQPIGFYLNDDESTWYHARLGDWINGTLFDGDVLKAYQKQYYKRVRKPWGYELVTEPISGVKITRVGESADKSEK